MQTAKVKEMYVRLEFDVLIVDRIAEIYKHSHNHVTAHDGSIWNWACIQCHDHDAYNVMITNIRGTGIGSFGLGFSLKITVFL